MTNQLTNRVVVAGVDGSVDALRAVRWAASEARRREATLRLVASFPWAEDRLPGVPGLGQTYGGDRLRAATEHASRRRQPPRPRPCPD